MSIFVFSNSSRNTIPRLPDILARKLFSAKPDSHPMYGSLGPKSSSSCLMTVQSMFIMSMDINFPRFRAISVFPWPLGPAKTNTKGLSVSWASFLWVC